MVNSTDNSSRGPGFNSQQVVTPVCNPPSSRGSDTLAQTYEQAKQNKTPMHTKVKINHLKSNHTGSLRQTGNGLFKQNLVEQATSAVL